MAYCAISLFSSFFQCHRQGNAIQGRERNTTLDFFVAAVSYFFFFFRFLRVVITEKRMLEPINDRFEMRDFLFLFFFFKKEEYFLKSDIRSTWRTIFLKLLLPNKGREEKFINIPYPECIRYSKDVLPGGKYLYESWIDNEISHGSLKNIGNTRTMNNSEGEK